MPYPSEHAARMRDPGDFTPGSFRRTSNKMGPGIDAIFGRLKGQTNLTLQAIRFDAKRYTAAQAKAWLEKAKMKPVSFEPASAPAKAEQVPDLLAVRSGEAVEFVEAKDDEDKKKQKRFKMAAYNGGLLELAGWYHPVVVDLDGLTFAKKSRPILLGHDPKRIVGHSDFVEAKDGRLRVEGVVSDATEAGREVSALSLEGFPWQASIGAKAVKVVRKEEGEKVTVNGQEFEGPLLVVRKSTLNEVSFVPLGADDSTSATVAASAAGVVTIEAEEKKMPKTKKEQETVEAEGTPETEQEAPSVETEAEAEAEATTKPDAIVKAMRQESARISAITAACKNAPEIAAQAVKEGWSPEKAELHAIKVEKTRQEQDSGISSPAVVTGEGQKPDLAAMKASMQILGRVNEADVEKDLGRKAVEASRKFRRLGLREMISCAAALDGVALKPGMSEKDWVRAAFSSISVSELLSDSANKSMLAAYSAVPSAARILAKSLTASDFKTHKGIRLTGDLLFKKVENGGEITHGTLGEDTFTYSVDTFGRLIGLTRQDLKNDDLGAFLQLPQLFGRGAALAVEKAFWVLVLANTGSFFSGGNANYQSGAATALSIDSLSAAEQLLAEMVDANGDPILVSGKYLVVPPALAATAQQIFVSTNLIDGTATAKQGQVNIHAGKYVPVSSPYLKSAAKAWYLWGDPADVAPFGIAWLDGVQAPVVEEVEVGPEYLGRAWRGYIDFGVCQIDKRGAVKSKGEA